MTDSAREDKTVLEFIEEQLNQGGRNLVLTFLGFVVCALMADFFWKATPEFGLLVLWLIFSGAAVGLCVLCMTVARKRQQSRLQVWWSFGLAIGIALFAPAVLALVSTLIDYFQ